MEVAHFEPSISVVETFQKQKSNNPKTKKELPAGVVLLISEQPKRNRERLIIPKEINSFYVMKEFHCESANTG